MSSAIIKAHATAANTIYMMHPLDLEKSLAFVSLVNVQGVDPKYTTNKALCNNGVGKYLTFMSL